jgi:hypothetical protein
MRIIGSECLGYDEDDVAGSSLATVSANAKRRSPERLAELLSALYTIDRTSVTTAQRALTSLPWGAVYTLNIDDLARYLPARVDGKKYVRRSALDPLCRRDLRPNQVPWIHLNGWTEDAAEATFSEDDFQDRLAALNEVDVASFAADVSTAPLLAVGTLLDEPHLWHALRVLAGSSDTALPAPPRTLVTRSLRRDRTDLLEDRGFDLVASGLDAYVADHVQPLLDDGGQWLRSELARAETADLAADWCEAVPAGAQVIANRRAESPGTQQRRGAFYLMGQEPDWETAAAVAVERSDESRVFEALGSAPGGFVLVSGGRGAGRSTAARRAVMRAETAGAWSLWVDGRAVSEADPIIDYLGSQDRLPLRVVIDDADAMERDLLGLAAFCAKQNPAIQLVAIATSQTAKQFDSTAGPAMVRLSRRESRAWPELRKRIREFGVSSASPEVLNRLDDQAVGEGVDLQEAMLTATRGEKHRTRVIDEYLNAAPGGRRIYGLVSVVRSWDAQLTQDEVLAIAPGRESRHDLAALLQDGTVVRTKRWITPRNGYIGNAIVQRLRADGGLQPIMESAARYFGAAAMQAPSGPQRRRARKMMGQAIRHRTVLEELGAEGAVSFYSNLQESLQDSWHFWLHRASLEIEASGSLELAESYLAQAAERAPTENAHAELRLSVAFHQLRFAERHASGPANPDQLMKLGDQVTGAFGETSDYPWDVAARGMLVDIHRASEEDLKERLRLASQYIEEGLNKHEHSLSLRHLQASISRGTRAATMLGGQSDAVGRRQIAEAFGSRPRRSISGL